MTEHARAILEHQRPAALNEQVVIHGREVLPVGQNLGHVRQAQRGELERLWYPPPSVASISLRIVGLS